MRGPLGHLPRPRPTLTASAGTSWCYFPECGRRWLHDRLDESCTELATHRITDHTGSVKACITHANEATQHLDDGAVIEPLT
ncbi:hypothetical protein ACIRO1_29700 [Streptomyces sp. NPDC102381]|uniref:hypothetical protein n=1 Tax=Streptomyces sp. NPDC102381 TaxID=3366164 RepID=UPI0037FB085F